MCPKQSVLHICSQDITGKRMELLVCVFQYSIINPFCTDFIKIELEMFVSLVPRDITNLS